MSPIQEMSCADAFELMLEAGLDEFTRPGGALSQHLASCEACRSKAQGITSGYADLHEGLDHVAAKTAKRTTRVLRWTPIPLAAAAAIVLMLTLPVREQPVQEPIKLAELMFPAEPVVTPPPGQQAVVMEKTDFTVVWLYEEKK